jgi:hypothetical protein
VFSRSGLRASPPSATVPEVAPDVPSRIESVASRYGFKLRSGRALFLRWLRFPLRLRDDLRLTVRFCIARIVSLESPASSPSRLFAQNRVARDILCCSAFAAPDPCYLSFSQYSFAVGPPPGGGARTTCNVSRVRKSSTMFVIMAFSQYSFEGLPPCAPGVFTRCSKTPSDSRSAFDADRRSNVVDDCKACRPAGPGVSIAALKVRAPAGHLRCL